MSRLSYKTFFSRLNESGCGYVIVGGLAVILHGHVRLTTDTDLVVDLAGEQLSELLVALDEMGFQPRAPVRLEEFADSTKRESWVREKGMQVFSLFHPNEPHWVVDLFVDSPIDFSELHRRSVTREIEDVPVTVASIDDLITMKRRAGRDIDLSDIRQLEQIREIPGDYV
jgi:hypothetical protein